MLSFGRGLQQVCPKSLVLPSLDLTGLLELLLDLQLLRLCSGWTKGRWGQGKGRRGGGGETTRGEERGEEETEAETGRGRETENMLDRGGGESCIQTRRDGIVLREIRNSQWARDAKKTRQVPRVCSQSWEGNSQETAGKFMDRRLGIFRILNAHKKL